MIPRVIPIRQTVASQQIDDVETEVLQGLNSLPLMEQIRPGMRIAVAVGSRGISCIFDVVKTVIEELRNYGAEPFLVPAMGSHGGGTAEGQRAVLEGYGFTPEALNLPILSSMDTVKLGTTPEGVSVYFDANAAQADGIVAINRIKEHTAFKGRWESGLLKILAIGLGKAKGATEIHSHDIAETIPAVARVIIEKMPVLLGVGIVENGYHQPAQIKVLPGHQIEAEEPALLDLARQLMPRIPLEPLDILVVKDMGKDISGTGMDLNIIGMWRRTGGLVTPKFNIVAALDLTEKSHGNAAGVGHADLITQRLRDKIDVQPTNKNCLTARNYAGGKIPMTLATDREIFEAGLKQDAPDQTRLAVVRNTLDLEILWMTEALLPQVAEHPALDPVGPARPLEFTPEGELIFPELP